jgi:hypothetical protein
MRLLVKSSLVLGLALLLAAPALAQNPRGQGQRQGRGPGGGSGGVGGLLQNESVQKELKIETAEAEKLKAAVQKVYDAHKDDLAKVREITDQAERRQKNQELGKTISDETLKAVSDILTADQLKRFKQIQLQQSGVQAFTQPEVQTALKLTDEQKDAIKTITEDAAKQRRDLTQGGGGRGQGNAEKMVAIRKESLDRAQKLLTPDQKKTWKDLTGDAFTIVRPQGRRGQQQQ